jgi:cytochrome c-type biogenesis protein CcmH/NrfF
MRRLALAGLWLGLALLVSSHVQAVTPDEMLKDPALEARARSLSEGLRCLVCQNQSIDASDADLARDLRILVRERLAAGDTDEQVMDYIVSRYGEFVLLKPRFDLRNALLWGAPFLLLLGGAVFVYAASRRRQPVEAAKLSKGEQDALDDVLNRN